ncbi:MAG: pilus assembly protein TadG-related protein [Hyphomicrobium sp.]
MDDLSKILTRLRGETHGSIVFLAAMLMPLALFVVGVTIDYGSTFAQRQRLQSIVDKSALAIAREMGLADPGRVNVADLVQARAMSAVQANAKGSVIPQVETSLSADPFEVSVTAKQRVTPLFGGGFGLIPSELKATAVARIVGRPNICLLALEGSEAAALWLVKSARMTGNGCSIFSNSTSSSGLVVRDEAVLTARTVCSAGGAEKSGTISPEALTDCPKFEDPLAARPEPEMGGCDYNDIKVANSTTTLQPGVYCGGLSISGTSDVTLAPGVFAIKDGLFVVNDQARLSGVDVSFQLGSKTWFTFGRETSVSLSASTSGPMAGLLLFASRAQAKIVTHTILSKNAQKLVGTIYRPNKSLMIDGDADVGGASAYTAIVARRVVLLNGPNLILNSNYDQTDVPVPADLRGADQPVKLVK